MSYVPSGYLPPQSAYLQTGYAQHDDPLIPPMHTGIGGWFNRIGGVFKRSWRPIAAIFLITYLLPTAILAVGSLYFSFLFVESLNIDSETGQADFDLDTATFFGFLGAFVAVILVLYVVQIAGYAAATYQATRDAAGLPVSLSQSLGYGFRRSLGLFGWMFLVGLLVAVGVIACILPGFYVIAATALVGPILLFERRNPIGRSFSIFHSNFGRVLGRLAMILLFLIGGGIASSVAQTVVQLVIDGSAGNTTFGAAVELSDIYTVGAVAAAVVGAVITIPITMLQFAGILVTYTEQRGYEGAHTQQLVQELG